MRDYYNPEDAARLSWVEQLGLALAALVYVLVWRRLTSPEVQRITRAATVRDAKIYVLAGRIVREQWCDGALQPIARRVAGRGAHPAAPVATKGMTQSEPPAGDPWGDAA